jgi:hypothetical protein
MTHGLHLQPQAAMPVFVAFQKIESSSPLRAHLPTTVHMTFLPRSRFLYPLQTPSWYAGHMASSIRRLPAILPEVDLVIEARDARLPLTSINPAFDNALDLAWGPVHGRGVERLNGNGKGKGKAKVLDGDMEGEERELDVRIRDRLIVYTKRDLADQVYEDVCLVVLPSCISTHVLMVVHMCSH